MYYPDVPALEPEELELLSGGEWCDLCKLPEPAAE